jgi:hypothetical protein
MVLLLNEDQRIVSYANIGGIEGGIDVDPETVPENFTDDFWPGKWAYREGAFVLTGVPRPEPPTVGPEASSTISTEQRLDEIEAALCELAEIVAGGGM